MSTLGRRVGTLEALAEEARLRPIRVLAEERGVPFDTLMRHVERVRAKRARLRAEGLTDDEITDRAAAERGITSAELRRWAHALMERLA